MPYGRKAEQLSSATEPERITTVAVGRYFVVSPSRLTGPKWTVRHGLGGGWLTDERPWLLPIVERASTKARAMVLAGLRERHAAKVDADLRKEVRAMRAEGLI